jgi:predicted ribosomally synthesized peptide with SipW-like signal peptide
MKKKSILTMVVSLALVGVIAVGSTLAYLTSTATKTNTFTVGKVNISETETKWESSGADHNLVPGVTLDKDPTFTVAAGSEDCYVYMKVAVADQKLKDIVSFNIDSSKWTEVGAGTGVYKYYQKVSAGATDSLFTKVTVDANATSETMSAIDTNAADTAKQITVSTFAIQADNLNGVNPDTKVVF